MLYPRALIMLSAVQFDAELTLVAIEVENVRTNRVLTTEFYTAELTAAQTVPQKFFCVSLLTTQLAHTYEVCWG